MFQMIKEQPKAFIHKLGYFPVNGCYVLYLYRDIITKQKIEEKYVEKLNEDEKLIIFVPYKYISFQNDT